MQLKKGCNRQKLNLKTDLPTIRVEKTTSLQIKITQRERAKKAICLAGKRACPPEDVGGTGGYENFLESIMDPDHKEHEEHIEWIGGEFVNLRPSFCQKPLFFCS
jgi:hypothetical protein